MKSSPRFDPIEQLRLFLANLPDGLVHPAMIVACSGGPDSMALLHAAASLSTEGRFSFLVAHINHKLRGRQSDGDEKFVRRAADQAELPILVKTARIKRAGSGNLEENAREARYAALAALAEQHRSHLILTAHTADDQAETVFMNFLRGSGGDGLAGIPPLRSLPGTNIQLGRPWLALPRTELHRWLRVVGKRSREDRTNRDDHMLRNWLRLRLFPQLEKRSPGFKRRLNKTAAVFRDEKAFWAAFLAPIELQCLRGDKRGPLLDLGGLLSYSAAVQRRFLRRVVGENVLTFDAVERLRQWMLSPPTGGRTFQIRQGWTVTRLSKTQGAPSVKLFLIKDENHK